MTDHSGRKHNKRLTETLSYMRDHIYRLRSRSMDADDYPYLDRSDYGHSAQDAYAKWLQAEGTDKELIELFDVWMAEHLTNKEARRIRAAIRQRLRRKSGAAGHTVTVTEDAYAILQMYSEADGITLSEVIERELGRSRRYRALRQAKREASG